MNRVSYLSLSKIVSFHHVDCSSSKTGSDTVVSSMPIPMYTVLFSSCPRCGGDANLSTEHTTGKKLTLRRLPPTTECTSTIFYSWNNQETQVFFWSRLTLPLLCSRAWYWSRVPFLCLTADDGDDGDGDGDVQCSLVPLFGFSLSALGKGGVGGSCFAILRARNLR